MTTPIEQVITELMIENKKLRDELEEAKSDILDFEKLGIEWKSGYDKMKTSLEIKIKHLQQTIEEMEKEQCQKK